MIYLLAFLIHMYLAAKINDPSKGVRWEDVGMATVYYWLFVKVFISDLSTITEYFKILTL